MSAEWLGVWRHALKTLKEQDTWAWELAPLLTEYVLALRASERARQAGEHANWDRHRKAAMQLADQLALTPRGRKAIGLRDDADDEDTKPSGLDAAPISLEELRARRAG
jgi:hypothetical protein